MQEEVFQYLLRSLLGVLCVLARGHVLRGLEQQFSPMPHYVDGGNVRIRWLLVGSLLMLQACGSSTSYSEDVSNTVLRAELAAISTGA